MIFNREVGCQKCKEIISRTEACTIDYSHQGKIKNGIKVRVCKECGLRELTGNIGTHRKKAIVVRPSSRYNAYVFYDFKDFKRTDENFCREIQRLLPKDGEKCSSCSSEAAYTWCTLSIFHKEDPFSMRISKTNKDNKENNIHVCKDCLTELLKKEMEADSIKLNEVMPMIDEAGFYTPWEA